ncbi:MAG: RagB/SusD family nutrient uptake outer membrane protein, partial [Bacteroidales bacterium]|nr:RagB/SusD family nutrient uptake outer membrane protein [Bacteroidales bacterium]
THPQVRHHTNRADPMSSYTVGDYQDYMIPEKVWNPRCLTFPYPSSQIAKSNGMLRNPPSWQ